MVRIAVLVTLLLGCRDAKQQAFRSTVEPKIVALFCTELPSYYRSCFDIDEAGCTARMQRDVHTCFDQLAHGEIDEHNVGDFTERVAACAGNAYELETTPITTAACTMARDGYTKARQASLAQ